MTRAQLEHILRAAGGVTGVDRLVVVGSQSILGQFPDAPEELRNSMEADVYAPGDANLAHLIDGSIGEGSPFHNTFGYHAHGVGVETATLPKDWMTRTIAVRSPNTGGVTGLCPEVHDLAVSKLVAGREKDLAFLAALLQHGLVQGRLIRERLVATEVTDGVRRACEARLTRLGA
ncbi:MAG: hypothetical protein HBSAPP03_11580 [Phycisphaerae bacterium]|nr:MAG: hypothetical protein HBSAPP03_11580 [Phycisphaerae bacterium]